MSKDLTNSVLDRQNILNNAYALWEIEPAAGSLDGTQCNPGNAHLEQAYPESARAPSGAPPQALSFRPTGEISAGQG